MGYVTNSAASGEQIGVCDVHRLVDGDVQSRRVLWCSICRAWLCAACRGDLLKRAKAMAIRRMRGER